MMQWSRPAFSLLYSGQLMFTSPTRPDSPCSCVPSDAALHLAADAGQCDSIARLIALGAPVDVTSNKGHTPLALALMKVCGKGKGSEGRQHVVCVHGTGAADHVTWAARASFGSVLLHAASPHSALDGMAQPLPTCVLHCCVALTQPCTLIHAYPPVQTTCRAPPTLRR